MLITSGTKTRYSIIMADSILHFIRLTQEKGILGLIVRCTKDQHSKEFTHLREMLISMFSSNLDKREMMLVFQEIDSLRMGGGATRN